MYDTCNFFSFFGIFFQRLVHFCTGHLPLVELASDEIQVGILALLGITASLLGSFLILRRMTMLANSLSHTILLGIVIAYLLFGYTLDLKVMGFAALISALLTAFLTEGLVKLFRLNEDASIGLVFSTLFALGIVLITTMTRNAHIGSEIIMGNLDAVKLSDLKLTATVFALNVGALLLLFRGYALTTFDAGFAKQIGISPRLFHYILMVQTALTSIAAFRAVGLVLVLALFVGPPLIAKLLTKRLKSMLLLSSLLSVVFALCSVALSRHFYNVHAAPLSTAGLTATLILIGFILTLIPKWRTA